jgi:hypothetical protein
MNNKKWAHRGQNIDGFWYYKFDTKEEAQIHLCNYANYIDMYSIRTGRIYYDDNGGAHSIMQVPDISEDQLIELEEAFDARECGDASDSQIKMLNIYGY